jgi:chaperonin GroEL
MSKTVLFSVEAKKKLFSGMKTVATAVGSTLGAAGRNVVIEMPAGVPKNTKDGVTVARHIELADHAENQGALIIKEAAVKTVNMAGDGTTTACVLTHAIIEEGFKMISEGASPVFVKSGIEDAVDRVVKAISESSMQIETEKQLIDIATISANNDRELGELIGKAFWSVGKGGEVAYEPSETTKTYTEIVSGMKVGSGWFHFQLVNNEQKQTFEAENCYVFVTDSIINSFVDIESILTPVIKEAAEKEVQPKPIIFFCSGMEGEALATVLGNHLKGLIRASVVMLPEYGSLRKEIAMDICAYTGAHFYSKDSGERAQKDIKKLGFVKKVTVSEKNTILFEGAGNPDERINGIRRQMAEIDGDSPTHHQMRNRVSRLSGKVAVLKVGGQTSSELNEKIDRVDDAINATRAAFEEGYLPGGGSTFFILRECLQSENNLSVDESMGRNIVYNALAVPYMKNTSNGGIDTPRFPSAMNEGYDMRSKRFVSDLTSLGIIDPAKVLRVALQNAASVAALFLITDTLIVNNDQK